MNRPGLKTNKQKREISENLWRKGFGEPRERVYEKRIVLAFSSMFRKNTCGNKLLEEYLEEGPQAF